MNSGSNIDVDDALAAAVEQKTRLRLGRFADRLTRVEIDVNDQDGAEHRPQRDRC